MENFRHKVNSTLALVTVLCLGYFQVRRFTHGHTGKLYLLLYTILKCGRNDFFAYFSNTNIGMGGGGAGFAFMLNEDMSQGTSAMSDTYGNSVLSFTEQFSCVQFEFWTFEDALTL